MLPDLLLHLLQEYLVHVLLAVSGAALVYWVTFRARGIPTVTRTDFAEMDRVREWWLLKNSYKYVASYRFDFGNAFDVRKWQILRIEVRQGSRASGNCGSYSTRRSGIPPFAFARTRPTT